ncbi:hypothetical protein MJO28_011617 [Puccinia striiformis f. sp. tritici]|uniref:Uncharacterized protein n=1 Tax=Puccinia striiformis f. sp. tritici TaxID=168172 RepID=A0ACC0E4M9_9BASI|nr:hypothetical protein MJO28_011617 [Puccinia striiformis f. sp. tritici]KAI7946856.1 hypothetical protein MJO29_011383 [Puccinia striiformis f. sp. tritici]
MNRATQRVEDKDHDIFCRTSTSPTTSAQQVYDNEWQISTYNTSRQTRAPREGELSPVNT